jgi:predicted O-methyltransferase YrrM
MIVSRKIDKIAESTRALGFLGLFGGNLAALVLLRRPQNVISYIQYGLFGWRMIKGQGLPMRQLHDLLAIPERISVELLPKESHLANWDANYAKDMFYLAILTKVQKAQTIFEIGTLHGETGLLFALNSSKDAIIYTLDLPLEDNIQSTLKTTAMDDSIIALRSRSNYLYLSQPDGQKVRQLYGDSAQFDFTPYHNSVDLFFIDGAHSCDYVRMDTLNALACVRKGGVIAWHDYGRWGVNGVSRWLHKFSRSGKAVYRLPGSSLAVYIKD